MDISAELIISFGTIIQLKDRRYVYLAGLSGIVYLALIIDGPDAREAKRILNSPYYGTQKRTQKQSYCFVELTTEEFKESVASLYQLDHNETDMESISDTLVKLNDTDIRRLKNSIKTSFDIANDLQAFVERLDK